jgi:hypothetical protein
MEDISEFDRVVLSIIKRNLHSIKFDRFLHSPTDEEMKIIEEYKKKDYEEMVRKNSEMVASWPEWKRNALIMRSQSTNSKPRESIYRWDSY